MKLTRFIMGCAALVGLFLGVALTAAESPAQARHIVFMIGEDEYRTWETLPAFARSDLEGQYRVTFVHASPTNKNDFAGLEKALETADLLFVSVRRRTPLKGQLEAVRAHVRSGKPLIGIRTASHAFAGRSSLGASAVASGLADWPEFDAEVLGGHYTGHYSTGAETQVVLAKGAEKHPIVQGIDAAALTSSASLYKVSPLAADAAPLLVGTIEGQPAEPIAWVRSAGPKKARVFYTSLGHTSDFARPVFRRLLASAIAWGLADR